LLVVRCVKREGEGRFMSWIFSWCSTPTFSV
jgi:hypothetical protein